MITTSCTQGSGDTATLQKKVDSLTAIVTNKGAKVAPMASFSPGKGLFTKKQINFSNSDPIETFTVPWGYSYWCAHRWDKFMTNSKYRDSVIKYSTACSFVIPTNTLQFLLNSGAEYVVAYLAVDTNYQIKIVYDGASTNPNEPQNDTIYEQPIMIDNKKYALDNVWPCPICDKVGLSEE